MSLEWDRVFFNDLLLLEIASFLNRPIVLDAVCKSIKSIRFQFDEYNLRIGDVPEKFPELLKDRVSDFSKQLTISFSTGFDITLFKELVASSRAIRLRHWSDSPDFTNLRNVSELELENGCEIRDINSFVADLTDRNPALTRLHIPGQAITNVDALAKCPNIKSLGLWYTKLSNLDKLGALKYLNRLNISNTEVRDISSLSALDKLTVLDIGKTRVSELKYLANLVRLRELRIDACPVESVAVLAHLTRLEALSLASIPATNFESLTGLHRLKELNAYRTEINDLTSLVNMSKLRRLNLSCTKVSDLRPLIHLVSLQILEMRDNVGVTDITPLCLIGSLGRIGLSGCGFPRLLPLLALRRLQSLSVGSPALIDIDEIRHFGRLTDISVTQIACLDAKVLMMDELRTININISHCGVKNLRLLKPREYGRVMCRNVRDLDSDITVNATLTGRF